MDEVRTKFVELRAGKRLCESVGELFVSRDIRAFDFASFGELAKVVKTKVDVATSFEIYRVFGLCNACCVVLINSGGCGFGITELVEKHARVRECACTIKGGVVLCFSRG